MADIYNLRRDTPQNVFNDDEIKLYKKSSLLNIIPYICKSYVITLNGEAYAYKKNVGFMNFINAFDFNNFFRYSNCTKIRYENGFLYNIENKIISSSSGRILFCICYTSSDLVFDYVFLIDKEMYTDPKYEKLKKNFKAYIINPNKDIEVIFTDDIEKLFLVDDFYPVFKSFNEEQQYIKKEEEEFVEYLKEVYGE